LVESGGSAPPNPDIAVCDPWLDLIWEVLALAAGGRLKLTPTFGLAHLPVKLDLRLRLLAKAQPLCLNARADLDIGVLDAIGVALASHR
jgi:hypothetical protein